MNELLRSVTQSQLRTDIPEFGSGDTVRVHAKVVEGTRERIQVFEGVVMRKRAGGIEANFTVRRVAGAWTGCVRRATRRAGCPAPVSPTRPARPVP